MAIAMLHPGSASCKRPGDPGEVAQPGSTMCTLSAANMALFIMEFIYLMTTQMHTTLFVLAAVAESGLDHTVASKSALSTAADSDEAVKKNVSVFVCLLYLDSTSANIVVYA